MTKMAEPGVTEATVTYTVGVDHVGLTVRDLAATRDFFVGCLGWRVVGENAAYPAVFVSDGHTRVTLWQVKEGAVPVAFDRHRNIGLHHLAFRIRDRETLEAVHRRLADWPGVVIEFAPEFSGQGPKVHCMIREPSGNRLEFAYDPR
jgi:catechol 2,3-dioxygenase-like lactoylglutathione lyase family enzyme